MKEKMILYMSLMAVVSAACAQDQNIEQQEKTKMSSKELFEKLHGKWAGNSRTWFEPDKLADESRVESEFTPVLGGRFLRHAYRGSMQGKPREGEELIALNSITKRYQVSWVDDFHMNYAIMFSQGDATDRGFEVRGEYDVGGGHPPWGWRTRYLLVDENQLHITAWNITPDGQEAKAIEIQLDRIVN